MNLATNCIVLWKKITDYIKGKQLTGISTPIGGIQWEDRDKKSRFNNSITIDNKIKVFISSICGDHGKYDILRDSLKKQIEATGLATVYLFSDRPGTTSAYNDYIWSVEESDLCIFIIDNKDGITQGVQNEIDAVNRNVIKSLYYFCNHKNCDKTQLQRSLEGPDKPKYKEITCFDELMNDGAKYLLEEITLTYHRYCKGRLVDYDPEIAVSVTGADIENLSSSEDLIKHDNLFLPKVTFKSIDNSADYILSKTVGIKGRTSFDGTPNSSLLDEYELTFLKIIFGEDSIESFPIKDFFDELEQIQTPEYISIVRTRWNAIVAYFNDDLEQCISELQKSYDLAINTGASSWMLQDILIDIRNIKILDGAINNSYSFEYQKKLDEFEEQFHYPILDRINSSLEEKYIKGLYKKKMDSPNTVYLGSNYSEFGSLFASIFLIAMYNGSLTHIKLFASKMKDFMFYLAEKYDDWGIRKNLLKFALVSAEEKELEQIKDAYPELMNKMDKDSAKEIIEFCNSLPILYERQKAIIKAIGVVGYYLSEEDFREYEEFIFDYIFKEMNLDKVPHLLGAIVFRNLKNVSGRLNQDKMMELCLKVLKRDFSAWYMDMFKFIKSIEFSKVKEEYRQRFIITIEGLLFDENGSIILSQDILPFIRISDRVNSERLDELLKERYPDYYYHHYLIDTCGGDEKIYLDFANELKESIVLHNATQGKNGRYLGYARRDYATLRDILKNKIMPSDEMIKDLISLSIQTVCESNESILTKIDAVEFLIFLLGIRPEFCEIYKKDLETMFNRRKELSTENVFDFSNVEPIALEFCIVLLYGEVSGEDKYFDLMEMISLIKDDIATLIKVVAIIRRFYEQPHFCLSERIETALFSNVLLWILNENLEIRWNACKILFALSKRIQEKALIERKLYDLMECECVYIKLLILNNIEQITLDEASQNLFLSKAKSDANYLVRKKALEISSK